MRVELDLLKEKQEVANVRARAYKQCSICYYNFKVKNRAFNVGDLMLRKVMQNTKKLNAGVLGLNWEDPYRVTNVL